MLEDHLTHTIRKNLDHVPTEGQDKLIKALAKFVLGMDDDDIFIIRGYAGTGKTSLLASLVKTPQREKKQDSFNGSYRQSCQSIVFLFQSSCNDYSQENL